MYTIGDISKIVNIPANTLRYYDEIGLLKPHLVENTNQYIQLMTLYSPEK